MKELTDCHLCLVKESLRQRDRVATQEELSRDDALQRIDELESGIRKKVRWQAPAQLDVCGLMVDVRCPCVSCSWPS